MLAGVPDVAASPTDLPDALTADDVGAASGDGGELAEYPQHRFVLAPGACDILLVRHGESAPYRPGHPVPEWEGHADPALAPVGEVQAQRLGERLAEAGVAAIYVSPLQRTAQTAAPLAARLGLVPTVDPDLAEVYLGEWEADGAFRRHTTHQHPVAIAVFVEQRWDVIPGAESTADLLVRVRRSLEAIAAAHPDQRVMVIAHAGVIAAILADIAQSRPFAFVGVENGSISEIVVEPGRMVLRRFNDVSHLAP